MLHYQQLFMSISNTFRVFPPCIGRCRVSINRRPLSLIKLLPYRRQHNIYFPKYGPPIKNVAVVGGGITGLTSAFYLSRSCPEIGITLFEGSDRLGGWVQSTIVNVGSGKVIFESGPRNLRPNKPNGWLTLQLVCRLLSVCCFITQYLFRV